MSTELKRSSVATVCLTYVVTDHLPTLHYEFYPFEFRNVFQRVAGNGDDIGELPFLDRADSVLPSHHLRCDRSCGLDGLCRGHTILDQIGELCGLRPMGKRSHSGSKRNFQASRNCQAATFLPHSFQAVLAPGSFGVP